MLDIYFIEDDTSIASCVKEYLDQRDCGVRVFPTVAEAKRALTGHVPRLVLLDWNMPDGGGDELCRWIRGTWGDLPIIFLTVRDDPRDIVEGFKNGADDYVVKPFELEVLYSRVLALLRRTKDASDRYLSCGGIVVDQARVTVFNNGREVILSPSEYRLLLLLMLNKGKTVTRQSLLDKLWDSGGNFVNDNTLTVAMKRLREKLGQPACVKTVRSFGYRVEDVP